MQIWPAIDLRGGKCVRLEQGDYGRETVFGDDPAATATRLIEEGAECLHIVDLDGARDGKPGNLAAIRAILAAVNVPCELGGGIRDEQSICDLIELGAARVVIGTKALREPQWFRSVVRKWPRKIVLGIDARDGMVATDGWLQTSSTPAVDLAREFESEPVAAIIYTDIARDGMMAGPNVAAMRAMATAVKLPVVASGGVSSVADVAELASTGLAGCIIGRALYEGKLTVADAKDAAKAKEQTT